MMAFIFGMKEDITIYDWQLAILFRMKTVDKSEEFWLDFSKQIAYSMADQLTNFKSTGVFRYSSYLFHLMLYQNHPIFSQYMHLNMYDPSFDPNRTIPVSAWTHVLSELSNPYEFWELFSAPAFSHLSPEPIENRLTLSVRGLMANSPIPCDYFFGSHHTIIRVHVFNGEPVLLPKVLTPRLAFLEVTRQMFVVDSDYGTGKKKRKMYDVPWVKKNMALLVRDAEHLLLRKLAVLGFLLIEDKWRYDPSSFITLWVKNNSVSAKIVHEGRPFWEDRRNPKEDIPNLYAKLTDLPFQGPKPWEMFYNKKKVFDPKLKMGTGLKKNLIRDREWKAEKIEAYWKYR